MWEPNEKRHLHSFETVHKTVLGHPLRTYLDTSLSGTRGKSIQNRHPNRSLTMLKATLESPDSNRTFLNCPILDSESLIQCH